MDCTSKIKSVLMLTMISRGTTPEQEIDQLDIPPMPIGDGSSYCPDDLTTTGTAFRDEEGNPIYYSVPESIERSLELNKAFARWAIEIAKSQAL